MLIYLLSNIKFIIIIIYCGNLILKKLLIFYNLRGGIMSDSVTNSVQATGGYGDGSISGNSTNENQIKLNKMEEMLNEPSSQDNSKNIHDLQDFLSQNPNYFSIDNGRIKINEDSMSDSDKSYLEDKLKTMVGTPYSHYVHFFDFSNLPQIEKVKEMMNNLSDSNSLDITDVKNLLSDNPDFFSIDGDQVKIDPAILNYPDKSKLNEVLTTMQRTGYNTLFNLDIPQKQLIFFKYQSLISEVISLRDNEVRLQNQLIDANDDIDNHSRVNDLDTLAEGAASALIPGGGTGLAAERNAEQDARIAKRNQIQQQLDDTNAKRGEKQHELNKLEKEYFELENSNQ